jgi:ABC-type molybdate transport system substrate-binding protein
VPTTAKATDAAKTFIAFLAGLAAKERLKAHGFEPPAR